MERDSLVEMIDLESSMLKLPATAVRRTKGSERCTVPTLCRLFQRGRCRQGVNCHQVHADPEVVRRHRDAVRANPPCCCIHNSGSEVNIRGLPPSLSIIVDGATTVTLLSMEPTRGLRDLYLTHGSLQLECTFAQLCRNHSGTSICRFGPLCGYLHVCRDSKLSHCSSGDVESFGHGTLPIASTDNTAITNSSSSSRRQYINDDPEEYKQRPALDDDGSRSEALDQDDHLATDGLIVSLDDINAEGRTSGTSGIKSPPPPDSRAKTEKKLAVAQETPHVHVPPGTTSTEMLNTDSDTAGLLVLLLSSSTSTSSPPVMYQRPSPPVVPLPSSMLNGSPSSSNSSQNRIISCSHNPYKQQQQQH